MYIIDRFDRINVRNMRRRQGYFLQTYFLANKKLSALFVKAKKVIFLNIKAAIISYWVAVGI